MEAGRLTRRQALGAAGAGALALALPGPASAVLRELRGGLRPELVTVTQTGFAAWWPTDAPADTGVRVFQRGRLIQDLVLARDQTVHAAAVDGLEPGTAYRYELHSSGRPMPRSVANPGRFRTLPRLEGERLATIAVLNDLHVGEHCSGTITNIGGESVPPCFSEDDYDDYAYRMSSAALAEVVELRPDLVVANGDLTDRGRPDEVRRAMELLRSTGIPLLVTRGNHDRRFHEADGACGPDGDCLRSEAFPEREPGDHALTSVARVGARVAVVGLDSCDPESGEGRLDLGGQVGWLDRTLRQLRGEDRIPLVAFHHHVATVANTAHPPPLVSGVSPTRGALDALRVIGAHGVPLTLHGHTHRNYLARDPLAPDTWFLENGAVKEYPAGYALLHIHEDGIVRTFHRPVAPFTREWTHTSARQIWGRHSDYTRGTLASRSFVLRFGRLARRGGPAPSLFGPLGVPRA